jgi:aquaporin Z
VIFGVEVLVTAFLMAVIFAVVYTKGLKGLTGVAIGGMVDLDIFFFFSFISGASMSPARSLATALLSGAMGDLWLY